MEKPPHQPREAFVGSARPGDAQEHHLQNVYGRPPDIRRTNPEELQNINPHGKRMWGEGTRRPIGLASAI